MNNIRAIENLTEEELKHGIFGGVTKGSWHEKYDQSAWVYLGGFSYELTEGDLICVMSQWGEVEDIHLVREKETNKSKGFAFIKYEDQRSTILAVDNFNGMKLLGRSLRCDHVEQYKLPKDIREKEAELLQDNPAAGLKLGPGHAYKDKELANEYDISNGVDLWNPNKNESSKRLPPQPVPTSDVRDDRDHVRKDDVHSDDGSQYSESRRRHKEKKSSKSHKKDKKGRRDPDRRRDDSDIDADSYDSREHSRRRRRSPSDSRERSRHQDTDYKRRDGRNHDNDRRRRDSRDRRRYSDEESEADSRRDRRKRRRSDSREVDRDHRRHRDRDDGESHRVADRTESQNEKKASREANERSKASHSSEHSDSDSDNSRRQPVDREKDAAEERRRAQRRAEEKAMFSAAAEVLSNSASGPSNSSAASARAGTGGLILSGTSGASTSWRGRRDPELRQRLAAAVDKKLHGNGSTFNSSRDGAADGEKRGGAYPQPGEVSGIGGFRRIR